MCVRIITIAITRGRDCCAVSLSDTAGVVEEGVLPGSDSSSVCKEAFYTEKQKTAAGQKHQQVQICGDSWNTYDSD